MKSTRLIVLLIKLGACLCGGFFLLLVFIMWMPGKSFVGKAVELDDNAQLIKAKLEDHVRVLAHDIGPRNLMREANLRTAAEYIESTWEALGYSVERQLVHREPAYNISIEIKGIQTPNRLLIVGAHYDSVAPDCPGANDNATGVAALLVLAKRLRERAPQSTVRLVAFVNEEPPYFQTSEMGSLVYAKSLFAEKKEVIGMICLETMGYFSDLPKSQSFPLPALSLFYPDKGNFIGFVGDISSRRLLKKSLGIFRQHATIASEGLAAPASIAGIGWSDHWSFWQLGYPAYMITDTAPFRYPYYHELSDTWDKIDYQSLARVVLGVEEVVVRMN